MNKKIFYLCFTVALIMTSSFFNSIQVKAEEHTHTIDCYEPKKHVHSGTPSVNAGCYQGAQSAPIPCGGSIVYRGTNSFHPSGAPSNVTVTLKVFQCDKCSYNIQNQDSGSWQIGDYYATCSQATYTYALSCGYEVGEYEENSLFLHTHEGVKTQFAGCYQRPVVKQTVCGGELGSSGGGGHMGNESDGSYKTCPTCGGNIISYSVTYCKKCGWSSGGGGHVCNGQMYPGTSNPDSDSSDTTASTDSYGVFTASHNSGEIMKLSNENDGIMLFANTCTQTIYEYALSCGKEDNSYCYADGTAAPLVCGKTVINIKQR